MEPSNLSNKVQAINWQQIKVISFDLDDTLWNNTGIIERCEQKVYEFLCEKHPPIREHFSLHSMLRISEQLQQTQDPAEQIAFENMTVLRKTALKQMLIETAGDLRLVNQAFTVFYHWRNQIQVPASSIELLKKLSKKYSLFANSNGNSNLNKLGLMQYFEGHFIAGIHGRAKPSPEMLQKICQLKNIEPQQMLHIGDSHLTDIQSAINAGVQHLEIDHNNIRELSSRI